MDLSTKDVRKVCESKQDRIPSRRKGGTVLKGGRRRRSGRSPVHQEPDSAIFPTVMTLEYIENKGSSGAVKTSMPLLPTTRG